jgi:quercetin dioxygenase-like cupin family protein
MTVEDVMKRIAIAATLLVFASSAFAAEQVPYTGPKVVSTPVTTLNTTITGQPIDVPQHPTVSVYTVVFPPGGQLPVHEHPYPHYVYVQEGTLTVVNMQTSETKQFHQGEFFAEMNNTWHFGKNDTTAPVRLLVIDQTPPGMGNMMTAPAK